MMMIEEEEVDIESLMIAKAKIVAEICATADNIQDKELRDIARTSAVVLLQSFIPNKPADLHVFQGRKQ